MLAGRAYPSEGVHVDFVQGGIGVDSGAGGCSCFGEYSGIHGGFYGMDG